MVHILVANILPLLAVALNLRKVDLVFIFEVELVPGWHELHTVGARRPIEEHKGGGVAVTSCLQVWVKGVFICLNRRFCRS